MSSSVSQCGADVTALTLCNSILDCSNDSTAIKFMKMAPDIFPQFIKIANNHNSNNSNDSMIPHQSDTDTTQSNETVYSQDDIKAAQQLLNMHSFITINSSLNDREKHSNHLNHLNHSKHSKHSKRSKHSKHPKHSNHSNHSKHPRKFKKINNCNDNMMMITDIELTDKLILDDLECIDDNFCLYSESISNLDRKFKLKQINFNKLQVQQNIFPYKCNYNGCYRLFKHKSLLKQHGLIHKSLKCNQCNKAFKKKKMLYQHLRNEHKMYFCIKCKNIYQTSIGLNNHKCINYKTKRMSTKTIKNHHKEKPFKCKNCNKSFSSKGNCKKHQIIHNAQRRYQCKICKKRYVQKWRFKKHQQQCS